MSKPHFVPMPSKEEEKQKAERDLRRILRESDQRASEIFKRRDPSRPDNSDDSTGDAPRK